MVDVVFAVPFAMDNTMRFLRALIQVGADTGVVDRLPWTVERLLTAKAFQR